MKSEQDLRIEAGRALQKAIAEHFGWERDGYGYPGEGCSFYETQPKPQRLVLTGHTAIALLRHILSLGQPGAVYFYFDADTGKHARCADHHPWAGRIVADGRRAADYR